MKDKDFIKIDDLFRGRPDKEERIPAGAWNNMQDLLNKAATTGGGASGGRYGMYALLALLTVGMGAGAVAWQQSSLPNPSAQMAMSAQPQDEAMAVAAPVASNITQTASSTKGNIEQQGSTTQSTAIANLHIAAPSNVNNKKDIVVANTNEAANNNSTSKHISDSKHQNKIAPSGKKATRAARRAQQMEQNAAAEMIAGIQQKGNNTTATPSLASTISNNDIVAAANNTLSQIDKSLFSPTEPKDLAYEAVVKVPNEKTKFVLPKDSEDWKKEIVENVNEINRKVNYTDLGNGKFAKQIDTIANKHFVRTRLEPLSTNDKLNLIAIASSVPKAFPIATAEVNIGVAAANIKEASANNSFNNLVLLSDYKVKSTANRQSLVARFYDMMSQYLDGQKPYYFGASLGGQAMFSSPMQTGFNIGVGGYYEFKERYTLGLEFKYLHNKYAGGGQVLDNFSTFRNQTFSNSTYTAIEQKHINEYALESSSYLELPITIRYQLSKLSLMGGLYGSYMTGTKYSAVLNKLNGGERMVSSDKPFVSASGSVVANDFKARYGMGLTIGAAYDFSRKLSLDMRINQNLWTNMKQASHLSESLYRSTSLQLSLFYFIGKKDKVIYMMNPK